MPPRWAKLATSVHVTLVGRDGSIAAVRGDGAEVAVPVGKYRLGMLAIALGGADDGRGWNYVFSSEVTSGDEALPSRRRWHDVQQGKLLALNPLGEVDADGHLLARFPVGRELYRPARSRYP